LKRWKIAWGSFAISKAQTHPYHIPRLESWLWQEDTFTEERIEEALRGWETL